jgi:hypothetical protein
MKVKLKKPITVGDKTVDEVDVDVDAITGADILFCIREAAGINGIVLAYKIDAEVHLQMVCKLTGIGRDLLIQGSGANLMRLIGPVRDFFLDSE